MKYLSDYMDQPQKNLFDSTGAFFAFSMKQFDEAKKEGIEYCSLPGGMICPKENVKTLVTGLDEIYVSSIKQDIEENGIDAIIVRELHNHECFYTWSTEDVEEKLVDYPGVTKERIKEMFRKEAANLPEDY